MDLLDFWKCHICEHADYLILVGHVDRGVEDAVDRVDAEYLDILIDLTGDEHMGPVTIG